MFTWCTRDDWKSEWFDFDWVCDYYGLFFSREEAVFNAEKHGVSNPVILEID